MDPGIHWSGVDRSRAVDEWTHRLQRIHLPNDGIRNLDFFRHKVFFHDSTVDAVVSVVVNVVVVVVVDVMKLLVARSFLSFGRQISLIV